MLDTFSIPKASGSLVRLLVCCTSLCVMPPLASADAAKPQALEHVAQGGSPPASTEQVSAGSQPDIPPCVPGGASMRAFEDLIRGYEGAELTSLRGLVDPRMPGSGAVFDAALREKQLTLDRTLRVSSVSSQCATRSAMVSFRWEKRLVSVYDRRTRVAAGTAQVLLVREEADGAPWRLAGVAGASPFVVSTALPTGPRPAPRAAAPQGPVNPSGPNNPPPGVGPTLPPGPTGAPANPGP